MPGVAGKGGEGEGLTLGPASFSQRLGHLVRVERLRQGSAVTGLDAKREAFSSSPKHGTGAYCSTGRHRLQPHGIFR